MRDARWTLAIAAAAVIATALHPDALLADGRVLLEPWRALTGPLVHATWGHLVRDLALTLIVGLAYERPLRRVWPWLCGLGLAAPTVAVLIATGASSYCGLSGLSHALLAAALVHELRARARPHPVIVAIAAGFVLKVAYELATNSPAFPMDLGLGVRQVPLAHAVGLAVGALVTWLPSTSGTAEAPRTCTTAR